MRTSAVRRSVPGRSPRTSISAVQSQDWAAACNNAMTALCPRVASPTARSTGRMRKARVRKAWRNRRGDGPSQRASRAPTRRRGVGSSFTSTNDRPQRPQVPAVVREPSSSCIWSRPECTLVSTQVVMRAWTFTRFRARGRSTSPSPSSGVMPRACRREGWADPAWRPRLQRGRCARNVHAQPGRRPAVKEEAEPRWAGASRRGV